MEYVLTESQQQEAARHALLAIRSAAAGDEESGLARPRLLAAMSEELSATGRAPSDFHRLLE